MSMICVRTVRLVLQRSAIVLLGCSLIAGCGGTDEELPPTAPVSGVVTYKGEPVKEAQVTFHPQRDGNPGTGRTEENGSFIITTYDAHDGAVPGIHVVTVELFPMGGLPGMEIETTGATPIPKKYADASKSPLRLEVKADSANDFQIELED